MRSPGWHSRHWTGGSATGRSAPFRPRLVVLDRDGKHYRGGQAIAVGESSLLVKFHREQHQIDTIEVPRSFAPTAAIASALCLEFSDDWELLAARDTVHLDAPPPDEADAVRRGLFYPGAIPAELC
jgi:hypothetical protein